MNQKEREFRSSQELRESLKQVLGNATLRQALDIIRVAPDEFPPTPVGVHTDTFYSREFAKGVGTNNAVKRLIELTKPIEATEIFQSESTRPEWEDHIPKEMRDALDQIRKTNQQ